MSTRREGKHSGFTLIEMMIVIVVIAILIGVLLPQFRGTQDEASIQRARAEMRTLATAVESYYIHNNNTLPTTLTTLITASPRIVSVVPDDPFRASGTDYSFAKDTNGVYYVIYSYGIDRAVGITGISTAGALTGTQGDDLCISNGTATTC